MKDALQLIVAKSPDAMQEAVATLRAISAGSPIVQERYNRTVDLALNDKGVDWTAADRALLASYLDVTRPQTRDHLIQIRITAEEKAAVQRMADEAGMNVADYVRSLLF